LKIKAIRIIGDPVLSKKARLVKIPVSARIRDLVEEMFKVMEADNGIGLAAPQIGESVRLIVLDTGKPGGRMVLVNPKIVSSSKDGVSFEEGCLSVPGVNAEVVRPVSVRVEALTLQGKRKVVEADDILARVLQHEIDHLDGVLFVDRISQDERKRLEPQLKALTRSARRGRLVTS
jgi:peptide deformylase